MAHEVFVVQAGQFQAPESFAKAVDGEIAKIKHNDLFRKPMNQPLKDAWQGACFALGYQKLIGRAVEVRLSSQEQFPDFKLRVDGAEHDFECVMAVNRRLGDVYRDDDRSGATVIPAPQNLPAFDPELIRKAVASKVAKMYQGIVHVLVYMNYDADDAKEEEVLAAVRAGGGDRLESVWLLANGRESGSTGPVSYMIRCAKESSVLASCPGWLSVPAVL